MPIRLPQRCQPDSIQEFREAARQRAEDARILASAGRRLAAIYLWGYAAEMTLKAAYFALVGHADNQPITRADLRAAALSAPALGVVWPGPNQFHDVRGWADLLVSRRASMPGLAYAIPGFGNEIVLRGTRLQLLWRETLRYHKNRAYEFEMNQVRNAAEWLLTHSLQL